MTHTGPPSLMCLALAGYITQDFLRDTDLGKMKTFLLLLSKGELGTVC